MSIGNIPSSPQDTPSLAPCKECACLRAEAAVLKDALEEAVYVLTPYTKPGYYKDDSAVEVVDLATVALSGTAGSALLDELSRLRKEKEIMFKRLMELESIAPKKIRDINGKIYVWHCPDELVPETQTEGNASPGEKTGDSQ